jgi:hypothetical protein
MNLLCSRAQVRKGMALVDERLHPAATWEFDADIAILTHSTTIQPRYQVSHSSSFPLPAVSEQMPRWGACASAIPWATVLILGLPILEGSMVAPLRT